MEIKKTIILSVVKKGKSFECGDLETLKLIMGATSVSGNLSTYGVKKVGNKFVVGVKTVKGRMLTLMERKAKIEKHLEIMRQVMYK